MAAMGKGELAAMVVFNHSDDNSMVFLEGRRREPDGTCGSHEYAKRTDYVSLWR